MHRDVAERNLGRIENDRACRFRQLDVDDLFAGETRVGEIDVKAEVVVARCDVAGKPLCRRGQRGKSQDRRCEEKPVGKAAHGTIMYKCSFRFS